MSKEVGLTTDGSFKTLSSWTEIEERLSFTDYFLPLIIDNTTGTKYYLDSLEEKYIEITGDYETFINSKLLTLNFFSGPSAINYFIEIIREFMRSKSIYYGYVDIQDAISYQNCGITAWEEESLAFNVWRANTESLMYDNIFSYTADGITLPDLGGFTSQTGYFDVGITSPSRPNLSFYAAGIT